MTPEVYRAAYEQANTELRSIFGQIEQLGVRRGQIERLLETLKPLTGSLSQGNSGFPDGELVQPGIDPYKSNWNQPDGVLSVV